MTSSRYAPKELLKSSEMHSMRDRRYGFFFSWRVFLYVTTSRNTRMGPAYPVPQRRMNKSINQTIPMQINDKRKQHKFKKDDNIRNSNHEPLRDLDMQIDSSLYRIIRKPFRTKKDTTSLRTNTHGIEGETRMIKANFGMNFLDLIECIEDYFKSGFNMSYF